LNEPAAPPLVLVVEDEFFILTDLDAALRDGGFNVLGASSGSEALRLIEAQGPLIRAIVTDVNLGTGPSGWDVANFARTQNAAMPIVYASGGNEADWAVHGVPKSVFVAKPFAPAQVVVAVSALLNDAGQV
jgi:DNA-binding response OmpR family regulator